MNKDNYIKSIDQLRISPDFEEKTAELMKAALKDKTKKKQVTKRLVLTFACAAILVSASAFAMNYDHLFLSKESPNVNITDHSNQGITVAKIELPTQDGKAARMRPLFVYQGKVYLHYNTAIDSIDGFTVNKDDMINLRGDYLGKTVGSLDEWSNQDDYATEFASTIGDSDVYTVKGYDSNYRLMVYTEYQGGFSCEIYDSFGGLTLTSGADFFGLMQLKDNITSYQWENYESWNNGKGELSEGANNDIFREFINKLYTSVPVSETTDMLTENTDYDSQKFIYLRTSDNLITSLRLFKDGYVYAPEVGYFQIDKNTFDAFWNMMPVFNPVSN